MSLHGLAMHGARAVLCALALLVFVAVGPARADEASIDFAGAVDGRFLIGTDGRYGGLLTTDFWLGNDVFRGGGVLGVGAFSEKSDVSSRVVTPVGLSLSVWPLGSGSGPTLAVRGGYYAGARKGGLYGAPWLSGALGYRIDLGEGASVRGGVDAWGAFGDGSGLFVAPYLGLGF